MNITDGLLTLFTQGYHGTYKAMRRKLAELCEVEEKQVKIKTIEGTIARLKKQGLIEKEGKDCKTTKPGKELLRSKMDPERPSFITLADKVNAKKNSLVMFDVPEDERYKRDWLRSELVGFGYVCIQKSVWFGPKLPEEFIRYLISSEMNKYVQIFRASEEIIDSSRF